MTSENEKESLDQKIGHVKMKQTLLLRKSKRHDKSRPTFIMFIIVFPVGKTIRNCFTGEV